jgi:protease I
MKRFIGIVLSVSILICGFFGVACSQQTSASKKAVMIIANQGFQDDEFAKPKGVLEANGIKVTVASNSLTQAVGMNGSTVKPDMLMQDIRVTDYDIIVFVGGMGATVYLDDPIAQKIAQDAVNAKKVVGAICIAPVCLAKAGVLKGKRATTYPVEENIRLLSSSGGNYTAQPVEKDGNIITANGPDSAKEFGEALVAALKSGSCGM